MAEGGSSDYLLVAAIDFGTTFSGYAFSFRSTSTNPDLHEKVIVNKSWGAALGFQSYKNPTSVLTNSAGEFIAFGYEAEKKYGEALEDVDTEPNMHLFRHFKMMLHNRDNVKTSAVVTSLDGTIMPALDIFAHAIRYLKNHLLNALKMERGTLPNQKDIRWVITVPAIWADESKQFMREAAFRAGCMERKDSKNLVIALEPEAASLCCRRMNIAQYETRETYTFHAGTKYLVLDCGGGTVDIAVHEMESHNKVNEIMRASGGPLGGTKVDSNFVLLLEDILGKDFLNHYRQTYPHEWLQFLTNFEKTKKSFELGAEQKLTLPITYSMGALFSKKNEGEPIDKHLKKFASKGVTFGNGMLVIKGDAAQNLFFPVIQGILGHVDKLLRDPKCEEGLDYIFMVGGFSECRILQQRVKHWFHETDTKVLIPAEAQLAIIKGAVIFGHRPREISSRIAKLSYGYRFEGTFDDEIHEKSRRILRNSVYKCKCLFRCVVEQGETIKTGEVRTRISNAGSVDQTSLTYCIFQKNGIPERPVQYTDVLGMTEIGKVRISLPGRGLDRKVQVSFKFGGTEFEVEAREMSSGNKASTKIDFLS